MKNFLIASVSILFASSQAIAQGTWSNERGFIVQSANDSEYSLTCDPGTSFNEVIVFNGPNALANEIERSYASLDPQDRKIEFYVNVGSESQIMKGDFSTENGDTSIIINSSNRLLKYALDFMSSDNEFSIDVQGPITGETYNILSGDAPSRKMTNEVLHHCRPVSKITHAQITPNSTEQNSSPASNEVPTRLNTTPNPKAQPVSYTVEKSTQSPNSTKIDVPINLQHQLDNSLKYILNTTCPFVTQSQAHVDANQDLAIRCTRLWATVASYK